MRCGLIVHLATFSVLVGCGSGATPLAKSPGTSAPPPVPVTTARVVVKDLPRTVRAIGQLQASQRVTVRPQIGGPLQAVLFREGDVVHVGQPLFELDSRPAQQALRQAQAAHDRSQAEVRQAEAVLLRDRALVSRAKTEAERSTSLLQGGMITPSADEQTQVVYQAALAVIVADEASIAAAQATVAAHRAAIEEAELHLSYCQVVAPLAGRTGALAIDAGNVVTAHQTDLVTIAQIQPLYVSFTVPENLLPALQVAYAAETLTVTLSHGGDGEESENGKNGKRDEKDTKGEKGRVNLIDNYVDPTTGTIRLRAVVANASSQRLPGQFAEVQLTLGVDAAALVVPVEALQAGQQGRFVYVVEPSSGPGVAARVTLRPVRVVRVSGGEAMVADGVQAGEQVVLDGQLRLLPGAAVTVVNGSPAAPAQDSSSAVTSDAGGSVPAKPVAP